MAHEYNLSVTVRGSIRSRSTLDALVKAVVADGVMEDDWAHHLRDETDALDYITSGEHRGGLTFTAREHGTGDLGTIEEVCFQHGLSFERVVDPDGENGADGTRRVFNPVILDEPFDLPGGSESDPVIRVADLRKAIGAATDTETALAAVRSYLDMAAAPTRGMPADFDVQIAPEAKAARIPSPAP